MRDAALHTQAGYGQARGLRKQGGGGGSLLGSLLIMGGILLGVVLGGGGGGSYFRKPPYAQVALPICQAGDFQTRAQVAMFGRFRA